MTHDELLAKIDEIKPLNSPAWNMQNALRAVVELHSPIETYNMNNVYKGWLTCAHCNDEMYPCPTIQAIEKELG